MSYFWVFISLLFAACFCNDHALAEEEPPAPAAEERAHFDPPIRLRAGDAFIDTSAFVAHTGPLLHDYDGDGKTDLLVGNFAGSIQLYRNVGTREKPDYEAKGLLEADGAAVKIPNW
ncbi:MAG: hypothetical protein L0Z55_00195 [Planctomycetes bacterium]|nr:hypothetical protein [Planctomycetota bacterium]